MTMRTQFSQLKQDILEHCRIDYVGLWVVASSIREDLGVDGDADVQRIALALVKDFLEQDLVVVGEIDWKSGEFQAWRLAPGEVLARIQREWNQLGRDPDQLEICWLTTTEAGDEWVSEHVDCAPSTGLIH